MDDIMTGNNPAVVCIAYKQLLVASSPQLAAISIGGINGFPNVLLHQLKSNGSIINLDNMDVATWIGSTNGLAGIPTILLPTIMQWKGRKFAFLLSCLFGIIGWIIASFAQSVIAIIIAEIFHGLSTHSLVSVSMLAVSEMINPKYRTISMNIYGVSQAFGMTLTTIIGQYYHWKTVAIIMSGPITLALLLGLAWPESPAWLAYKKDYDKCINAFKKLRGTDINSLKELDELIAAQKEMLAQHRSFNLNNNNYSYYWSILTSRDFYIPCLHTFLLLSLMYWSGTMVLLIYTVDMLQQVTSSKSAAFTSMIVIYIIMCIGNCICIILLKYYKNKTVIVTGGSGMAVFLFLAFIVAYLQSIGVLPLDSYLCLYCLIGFTASFSTGVATPVFAISAELMPVKHRGLGGALYVILICLLHSSSLKLSPYLFLYINMWGTFLLYAVNALVCTVFISRYVQETKNKTLQQIEDWYNYGREIKRCDYGQLKI